MEKSINEEAKSKLPSQENEPNLISDKKDLITQNEQMVNNNGSESESSENSDFDIDYERLTLIQVGAKIKKSREEKKKNFSFLNKKRSNPDTNISYDSSTKKLCNTFCPDYNDLNMFLSKCKVREINSDYLKYNEKEENTKSIFDPFDFMEKYNIKKTTLSFEDDLCQNQDNSYLDRDKINKSHYEIKEIMPTLSIPRMNANQFILSFNLNDDKIREKVKEDFIQLGNILNTDVLDKFQKNWINDFIKKINNLPLNEVIYKNKKLQIIFDLDLTCIFSFVNSTSEREAIFYKERYPEKNIHILKFEYQTKMMFSSVIIRKGLKDFVNYVKDFCNFHIRTQGVSPYASKIAEILMKDLGIEFQLIKTRECNWPNNLNNKCLEDFNDVNINNNNSIIFDDSMNVWKKDLPNVIQSKKFIDKECGVYSQKEKDKDKSSLDNDITRMQNTYSSFFYHKIEKSEKPSWKSQIVCTESKCPFYQYRDKNAQNYNLVYSGEYLNSQKLQFFYMKNVIKEIYYLVYHNEVPIFDAIKLIRLNTLNGKSFYLKYLNENQKIILSDIIKVCGGEIIYKPDDSIDFLIKTIFLVFSMENYVNERNSIQEELNKNKKYILINEKYILDSYYFMTDLGNCYKDNEYNPEKCFCL